jgi:hypothetical protein
LSAGNYTLPDLATANRFQSVRGYRAPAPSSRGRIATATGAHIELSRRATSDTEVGALLFHLPGGGNGFEHMLL